MRDRAGDETAHSESKDVLTKVLSFVSTEESGDQLELGSLTTENVVQGSQQLSPDHDARKDCPQGGRNKV